MRFARWVFAIAGITGILIVAPMYFMESQFAKDDPPPLNHPEFFYGFAGVTLAWQVMFLVIASDPIRYRPAMLVAVLEKAGFVIAIPVLYSLNRVSAMWFGPVAMDGTLGILFVVSYLRIAKGGIRS